MLFVVSIFVAGMMVLRRLFVVPTEKTQSKSKQRQRERETTKEKRDDSAERDDSGG